MSISAGGRAKGQPPTAHLGGVHDVSEEITWPKRPDVIVHDSGGFEAAGVEEFQAIEDFLRVKSAAVEVSTTLLKNITPCKFCLEASNSRPTQTATKKLFLAIERYAQDVPVLVIATKKDEFQGIKQLEGRRWLSGQNKPVTLETLDEDAENKLQERVEMIKDAILGLQGGRFDACRAISKYDDETITELSKISSECFSHERIRLLYIRAQIARIDLKIDLAVCETMRIYKDVLASAVSLAGMPLGISTNRFASAIELFRVILSCFGLPSVTPEVAYGIFKSQLFEDLGGDFAVLFAECMTAYCAMMSVASLGMPIFLVPMVTNIPLVVPAAERLILMLACDLILVCSRCFQETSTKYTQPKVDVLKQSVALYRKYYKEVHLRISVALPKRNVAKFFRVSEVQETFKQIFEDFKKKVMTEPTSTMPQYRNSWDNAAPKRSVALPSRSSISSTIGVDSLGNEEGPDQAAISEQDDGELVEQTMNSLERI